MNSGKTLPAGACKLCRKYYPLIYSHIIPEFLYKPLYDSKHRMHLLSTEGRSKSRIEQKGVREYLLCHDCEQQFSRYERYGRGVLFGGEPIDVLSNYAYGFEARVDYQRFKLFQMSLLWRTGITSRPEFQDIELGGHEHEILGMLQREDPGAPSEYGCVLHWPTSHRDIVDNVVMSMGMTTVHGTPCVRLLLAGMCWLFFLTTTPVDSRQEQLFLQQDGSLRIICGEFGVPTYIQKLAEELHENNPEMFRKDQ